MARRSEHSLDEIKAMALQAAEHIVEKNGFGALTARKIAQDIGYSAGSIYMVFANMDDLINHVKAATLRRLAAQLHEAVGGERDAAQALLKLAEAYLRFVRGNFNLWCMIVEHSPSDGQALPAWYRQCIDNVFAYPQAAFRALQPARGDAEIKRAAAAYWGGIHGICMLSLSGKLDDVAGEALDETVLLLADSFIRGWRDTANPAAGAAKSTASR